MYYAALRPSEAVDLRKEALTLPRTGWGELYLSTSAPAAGRAWSEGGTRREPRQLKHRAVDEVRIVPCPPELTALLHTHLSEHGTAPGRPAVPRHPRRPACGERLRPDWGRARAAACPRRVRLPLARRPYDLRHAAVSTWLNAACPRPGGAVGRAQRRRPAAGLRQVHRRPGGRCRAAGSRRPCAPDRPRSRP